MFSLTRPRGFAWPSSSHVVFIECTDREAPSGTGLKNEGQATIASTVAQSMILGKDVAARDVAVISGYRVQIRCIRKQLRKVLCLQRHTFR